MKTTIRITSSIKMNAVQTCEATITADLSEHIVRKSAIHEADQFKNRDKDGGYAEVRPATLTSETGVVEITILSGRGVLGFAGRLEVRLERLYSICAAQSSSTATRIDVDAHLDRIQSRENHADMG